MMNVHQHGGLVSSYLAVVVEGPKQGERRGHLVVAHSRVDRDFLVVYAAVLLDRGRVALHGLDATATVS